MTETTTNTGTSPATVGKAFMRHYYQFLAKDPQSLHRFYKDESLWCHGTGSQMQEPISGQRAINDEILRRGYTGVRVDLEHGSIDCQGSLSGGVFVLVTGVMTFAGAASTPKPFVQTFFLAVQPNGYFVLNDCLRFLELPTSSATLSAADAAVAPKDVKKSSPQSAIGTPVQSSPAPKGVSKPVTPVATAKKQDKTPTSPVAKPVEAPVPASPTKTAVKNLAKDLASPKAVPSSPLPSSPMKKPATPAKMEKAKLSETKTATPSSPASAAVTKTPASPAAKPTPAPAPTPVAVQAPAKPTTWASLFNPSTASPASKSATVVAPVSAPAPKSAPSAPSTAVAAPSSPTKSSKPIETTEIPANKVKYYTIFVRDVPNAAKNNELRELFEEFGPIATVHIVAGRGYAFVDFHQEESMRAALAKPAGEFKLHGKTLLVNERKEVTGGGGRGNAGRGVGGGRGFSKNTGGRSFHDSKESRRPEGNAPSSSNGPRSEGGARSQNNKGGRRGGKEEGTSN